MNIMHIAILILIIICIFSLPSFCNNANTTKDNNDNKSLSQPYSTNSLPERSSDGDRVKLIFNPIAHDPTWDELLWFLRGDDTDTIMYDNVRFVCADFAERLQNNSEKADIKCGYVGIDFMDKSAGHACNVFNTTDKGTVFIDCTGRKYTIPHDTYDDRIVENLKVGNYYTLTIFDYSDLTEYQKLMIPYQELMTPYQELVTSYQSLSALYNARVTSKEHVVGPLTYKKLIQEENNTKIQMAQLSSKMAELSIKMDPILLKMNAIKEKWGFAGTKSQFNAVGIIANYKINWP